MNNTATLSTGCVCTSQPQSSAADCHSNGQVRIARESMPWSWMLHGLPTLATLPYGMHRFCCFYAGQCCRGQKYSSMRHLQKGKHHWDYCCGRIVFTITLVVPFAIRAVKNANVREIQDVAVEGPDCRDWDYRCSSPPLVQVCAEWSFKP